jgi:hypothetical protein
MELSIKCLFTYGWTLCLRIKILHIWKAHVSCHQQRLIHLWHFRRNSKGFFILFSREEVFACSDIHAGVVNG